MCAVTVGNNLYNFQQFNKDTDLILILNVAIDYLHFVF